MHPHEELRLLIESVEDDIARAVRSGNVALARQFAQELRARFPIYRDVCEGAGSSGPSGHRERRRAAERLIQERGTALS